jgi:hypothetical protein
LAIQYCDLYCILNEQNMIVSELWDEQNLRCTFPRRVDLRTYNIWEEVVSIASTVSLIEDDDEMV